MQTTIPPDLDRTIQNQSKQMQKQQSDFAALQSEVKSMQGTMQKVQQQQQVQDQISQQLQKDLQARTCRIESSSAAARGPLATCDRSSDVTVSRSNGHGLPSDHAGDAADALRKKKLQNHKNRITYAINSFAKDVATKGKISQCILTIQVVLLLCCQQRGEITCQPGTSTLCGVPPLEDWLITNHLRGGVDSGALGSNFGFQYQQIQKLQNDDYSFPQRSVCGVPEGDPLSVAAAVVVGAQLLHVIQQRTQALLLVYIDNVELISSDESQICQATDLTLDFFAQWGLKIDLAKSWAWSNVPTRKIGDKNRFQYSRAKTNLGCFSKYRKSTIHGEFGDRLATAIKRAAAIAALPYDLDGRMQAIEAGAGFFASDVRYIGKRKLAMMRTAVTKAIVKPVQGVNRKVAIQTYEDGHFEPTLIAVRRACATARRAFATLTSSPISGAPYTAVMATLRKHSARLVS